MGVCPEEAITPDDDCLPALTGKCTGCGLCRKVCPGDEFDIPGFYRETYRHDFTFDNHMGHFENTYVCQARDPEFRYNSSSGGAGTSLGVALLRSGEVDGVGVVCMDDARPWRAKPTLAKDEETIVRASQSKYAFTPMLKLLGEMRKEGGKYAIFVLPCQAMALKKVQKEAPHIADCVKYVIALCCHYNMTHRSIEELMERYGIRPENVSKLEYRGGGWPGRIQFTTKNGHVLGVPESIMKSALSYLFTIYTPNRCKFCPDGFCLFSDLSLGDFRCNDYSGEFSEMTNRTFVIQRTEKGAKALEIAQKQELLHIARLPGSEEPKRLTRVFKHKREFASAFIEESRRKGLPYPEFHFNTGGKTAFKQLRAYYLSPYYLFRRARKYKIFRKLFLKLFFSPAGELFAKMNSLRRGIMFKNRKTVS